LQPEYKEIQFPWLNAVIRMDSLNLFQIALE
jgi:hypothetical protein